jgi:hypothetical protein
MKKSLMLFTLVSSVLMSCAQADTRPSYQPATVVSIKSHEAPSNYAGSNPSDAPLQAEVHSYDIGIRLNCTVYQVRYETAFEYLPSVFAPNHTVEVNLQKHVMYVGFPGDRPMRMGIGSRSHVKDTSCIAAN